MAGSTTLNGRLRFPSSRAVPLTDYGAQLSMQPRPRRSHAKECRSTAAGLTTKCLTESMPIKNVNTRAKRPVMLGRKFAERKPVSYTHLRAHETDSYLVCRLLLEKK